MADVRPGTTANKTKKPDNPSSPQAQPVIVPKGQQRVPATTNKVSTKVKTPVSVDAIPVKQNYSRGIKAVLQQIHPHFSLDRVALETINTFVNDIFHRIASEAGELAQRSGRKTIGTRDIEAAVRIVLAGGELSKFAINEATRAINRYEQSLQADRKP